MKKTIIFIALLFFSQHSFSQGPGWLWAKQMGGTNEDYCTGMVTDTVGNAYTIGYFQGTIDLDPGPAVYNRTSVAQRDIFVSKLDASGNFVWGQTFGGTAQEFGRAIATDDSGNVYITGEVYGSTDFNPGPGFAIIGGAGSYDIYICKYNTAGGLVWARAFGAASIDDGRTIAVDDSGNVFVSGGISGTVDFDPGPGTYYLSACNYVLKLNRNGNFVWARSEGISYIYKLTLDAASNVYLTGFFGNTIDFDPGAGVYNLSSAGGWDVFVCKLDNPGNFVWARAFGGGNDDVSYCVAVDTAGSGSVYLTGYFNDTADFDPGPGTYYQFSNSSRDIFISKLDASGNFLWADAFGGSIFDEGLSLAVDPWGSGSVYTTGYYTDTVDFDPGPATYYLFSGNNNQTFISKLDSSGNFVWVKRAGGTLNEQGQALSITPSRYIYIAGRSTSPTVTYGIHTVTNASTGYDTYVAKLTATVLNDSIVAPIQSPPFFHTSCPNACDAYATVYPYDGYPPYHFQWSTSAADTLATDSNLCAILAWYVVTVTDSLASVKTDSVYIADPPAPVSAITNGDTVICGNSFTLFANLPSSPYSGHWEVVAGCGSFSPDSLFYNVQVTGMCGTNSFVWVVGNATCHTADTVTIIDSCFVGVDELTGAHSVLIFPNPSGNVFTISSGTEMNAEIEIRNVLGKKIFTESFRGFTKQVRLNAPAGIYFVRVFNHETMVTKKLIVE